MSQQKKDKIEEITERLIPVLRKHQVKRAGVFGSVSRGDFANASDIDIAVEVPRGTGLIKFGRIKLDLEEVVGKKVDLITYPVTSSSFASSISKDLVEIYATV